MKISTLNKEAMLKLYEEMSAEPPPYDDEEGILAEVEEILSASTLEDAAKVVVDFWPYKDGSPMDQSQGERFCHAFRLRAGVPSLDFGQAVASAKHAAEEMRDLLGLDDIYILLFASGLTVEEIRELPSKIEDSEANFLLAR